MKASTSNLVMPIWPVIVYGLVCVFFFVSTVLNIYQKIEPFMLDYQKTISMLFDPQYVGNGMGFTRWFFTDFWSGIPVLCLALILRQKHCFSMSILFIPFFFISIAPGWWCHFIFYGHDFFNYHPANYGLLILSLVAYLYLFLNLILTRRKKQR